MQVDLLRLILAGFTCYRLSRLLAWEEGPFGALTWARVTISGLPVRDQQDTLMGRFLTCPYCLGVWVALGLYFLLLYPTAIGDAFLIVAGLAGAQAYLQGTSD